MKKGRPTTAQTTRRYKLVSEPANDTSSPWITASAAFFELNIRFQIRWRFLLPAKLSQIYHFLGVPQIGVF